LDLGISTLTFAAATRFGQISNIGYSEAEENGMRLKPYFLTRRTVFFISKLYESRDGNEVYSNP
jgi:hypothetical protein